MKTMISAMPMAAVAVLALAGAAQEEVDEQLIAAATEAERFRYASARLSLCELSRMMNKNLGVDDNALKDLFPMARKTLEKVQNDRSLDSLIRRSILDSLLRGSKYLGDRADPMEEGAGARPSMDDIRREDEIHAQNLSLEYPWVPSVEEVSEMFSTLTGTEIVLTPSVQALQSRMRKPLKELEGRSRFNGYEFLRLLTTESGMTYRIRGGAIELFTPDDEPLSLGQIHGLARDVVQSLGMIGPAASGAIPILDKLSDHYDPQIAERAKAALRQIRDG